MKKNLVKRSKKGFTLAELLVVVAIIAVLVAIAVPTYNAATTKAEKAVVQANCRAALGEATATYLGDGTVKTGTIQYDGTKFEYTWTVTETAGKNAEVSVSGGSDKWTTSCSTSSPSPAECKAK